jgi:hypothetical protein
MRLTIASGRVRHGVALVAARVPALAKTPVAEEALSVKRPSSAHRSLPSTKQDN